MVVVGLKFHHKIFLPIAIQIDDELDITPQKTYDTLHYTLTEQMLAVHAAWCHNVPMVMVYDSNKKLVGYDFKYETHIIQE